MFGRTYVILYFDLVQSLSNNASDKKCCQGDTYMSNTDTKNIIFIVCRLLDEMLHNEYHKKTSIYSIIIRKQIESDA